MGLQETLDNLYPHDSIELDAEDSDLMALVRQETSDFILGRPTFGQEIHREDELSMYPSINSTLEEMLENLGLTTSEAGPSLASTEEEVYSLIIRMDFDIDAKAEKWKNAKEALVISRDEPKAQKELAEFQNYFLDAQAIIYRVAAKRGGLADVLKTAILRTLAGWILDVREVKEGLRKGESSISSGRSIVQIQGQQLNQISDARFLADLARRDQTTLLFAFLPMVLHDYGRLSHTWCDTLLVMERPE